MGILVFTFGDYSEYHIGFILQCEDGLEIAVRDAVWERRAAGQRYTEAEYQIYRETREVHDGILVEFQTENLEPKKPKGPAKSTRENMAAYEVKREAWRKEHHQWSEKFRVVKKKFEDTVGPIIKERINAELEPVPELSEMLEAKFGSSVQIVDYKEAYEGEDDRRMYGRLTLAPS